MCHVFCGSIGAICWPLTAENMGPPRRHMLRAIRLRAYASSRDGKLFTRVQFLHAAVQRGRSGLAGAAFMFEEQDQRSRNVRDPEADRERQEGAHAERLMVGHHPGTAQRQADRRQYSARPRYLLGTRSVCGYAQLCVGRGAERYCRRQNQPGRSQHAISYAVRFRSRSVRAGTRPSLPFAAERLVHGDQTPYQPLIVLRDLVPYFRNVDRVGRARYGAVRSVVVA
jgi:hypothetical protein